METRQIKMLNSELKIKVDDIDYLKLSKHRWYLVKKGGNRAIRFSKEKCKTRSIQIAREILGINGNMFVDHINGDALDNRRLNLRVCTKAQNHQNQKIRSDSKTGYKGVKYRKERGHWQARICVNGERIYLGSYNSPEKAHKAYCDAAKKNFGEFARFK